MTDRLTPEQIRRAAEALKALIRDHRPGGCRLVSGPCECPLCCVDALCQMALEGETARRQAFEEAIQVVKDATLPSGYEWNAAMARVRSKIEAARDRTGETR